MPNVVSELIEYLETVSAKVKGIEAEGERLLQSGGQDAFQAKLEQKASLLAKLAEKTSPLTEQMERPLGEEVSQRLEQFSMSASTALRIGSVFFMTALLYPEAHKPGEPNELEVFIATLKKKV